MTGGDSGSLQWDLTPYAEYAIALWNDYFFLVLFSGYLAWSVFIYRIAVKAGLENAGHAFIPVFQGVPLAEAAGRPFWWGLSILIPGWGHFALGYIGMGLAEQRDQPRWLGALCAIPGVHAFILGYFAFFDPPRPEYVPAWVEEPDPLGKSFRAPVPTSLPPGRALCRRCGLVYGTCDQAWARFGCCSLACARRAAPTDSGS